jgi:acetophenone carboxylase
VFIKLGVSSMLRSGDLVTGIYAPSGDMVAAWCGTYLHAVVGQLPIKYITTTWKNEPTVTVNDGDIFYCSDPLYGGIHNCDQIVIMPVFNDGELLAWTSAAVHQPETGACEPGGMPLTAKTRHDEGMLLSPIKIGENFRLREDLVEMCVNLMSRAPRMQAIDMRARLSAADRLRGRLVALAKEKGNDFGVGVVKANSLEPQHLDSFIKQAQQLAKLNKTSKYALPEVGQVYPEIQLAEDKILVEVAAEGMPYERHGV